jgi:DNA-binding transcriptional LysR family regulator
VGGIIPESRAASPRNQHLGRPRVEAFLVLVPGLAPMQIDQIRYFLAVCEDRNFTRAGKRCGIRQSSMSNAIMSLEDEFGGALFSRRPRVALTGLGQSLQPYLRQIIEAAELAHAAAAKFNADLSDAA